MTALQIGWQPARFAVRAKGPWLTPLLLLVCVLSLSPFARAKDKEPESPAPAGSYRRPLGNDPRTLDPARISDIYGPPVTHQIFDGLVRFDHTLTSWPRPVLALIAGWPHGTSTLQIVPSRPGDRRRCRFFAHTDFDLNQSGAADRTRDQGCAGLRPGHAARRPLGAHRYTVQVVPNEAPRRPVRAAVPPDQPRDIVEQQARHSGQSGGTGPFKFVRWEPERDRPANTGLLTAHPAGAARSSHLPWRGDQPDLPGVHGHRREPVPDVPNKISDPRYQCVRRLTFSVRFYGLNTRVKPLSDVRVRQAIAHALDRETMIQEIFLGQHQPARGILPAGMPGYNPQLRTPGYDPTRARALLKEAGFPEGRGLPTIEIWSAARSERIEKEMLGVKRQLTAVGIPAEVQYETNWPAFSQRLTENRFSMFVYAWHADVPDPDNFLFKLFHSQSPRNLTHYANPIVDDLLFQARRERDAVRRTEIYRRAEQIIVDEVPVVPVWHYTFERLFQSYVRNVEVNGLGDAYLPLRKVWLEAPRR